MGTINLMKNLTKKGIHIAVVDGSSLQGLEIRDIIKQNKKKLLATENYWRSLSLTLKERRLRDVRKGMKLCE